MQAAVHSKYASLFGALAVLAGVCFLRVAGTKTIQVTDIAHPGCIQFWNSKTREERGLHHLAPSRYDDEAKALAHPFMVGQSRQSKMLVWHASETRWEAHMARCLGGTV